MTTTSKTGSALANAGLLLVLAGTAIPLLAHNLFTTTRWVFTAGAALTLLGRILQRLQPTAPDEPLRLRRLRRMETWSAILFAVAAVFMFLRNVGPTDWIAFTLAGAVLTLYTSIAIPRASKG